MEEILGARKSLGFGVPVLVQILTPDLTLPCPSGLP